MILIFLVIDRAKIRRKPPLKLGLELSPDSALYSGVHAELRAVLVHKLTLTI